MRVLFCDTGSESLGVGYLAAVMKRAGHVVDLISDPGLDSTSYWHIPALRFLNRYPRLVRMAQKFQPDLVAFSALTNNYSSTLEMSKRIKAVMDVPTIIGGTHATALPDHCLGNPHMDMVCVGEGEEAMLELVTRMEAGEDIYDIRNIWFKKDGETIRNPVRPLIQDLDALPFPEKDMYDKYGYIGGNILAIASRGCPFRCTYCEISTLDGVYGTARGKFRRRSVDNVIAELREVKKRRNAKLIGWGDPIFLTNTKWVTAFLKRFKEEIDLPYFCMGRPENINKDLVEGMKDTGCATLFMGLDSGDPTLRKDVLNRYCSDERILDAVRLIQEAGIPLHLSAMFGLPGESEEEMWKTMEMVEKIDPFAVSTYTLFPFPGTVFYQRMIEDGTLDEKTLKKIKDGMGGVHLFSVIKHPHAKLAMSIANLLPLYVRVPKFFRPAVKLMMKMRAPRLSSFLFIPIGFLVYPVHSSIMGWQFVRAFLNIFKKLPILTPEDAPDKPVKPRVRQSA